MTLWMVVAAVLTAALLPCGVAVARGGLGARVVALQLAGLVTTLDLLALAEALGRAALFDLPLTLALLSWPSGLLYAHFCARSR